MVGRLARRVASLAARTRDTAPRGGQSNMPHSPPTRGGTHVVRHHHESQHLADNLLGDPGERDLFVYLPPGYEESDRRYETESDVVELAAVADRDGAMLIDAIVADAGLPADRDPRPDRASLVARVERRPGRHPAPRAVGTDVVVIGHEQIDLALQLGDRVRRRLLARNVLSVRWNRSTLPQVCGW